MLIGQSNGVEGTAAQVQEMSSMFRSVWEFHESATGWEMGKYGNTPSYSKLVCCMSTSWAPLVTFAVDRAK